MRDVHAFANAVASAHRAERERADKVYLTIELPDARDVEVPIDVETFAFFGEGREWTSVRGDVTVV